MRIFLLLLFLAVSGSALAHPGDHAGGFAHGFAHPFFGIDHLLAMVIVGLWASRIAGSIRWVLPGAFVAFMAVGAALGGLPLPLVEPMILLSILVFALGTVMAKRLPVWAGGLIVALFALYHGHAHFTEIPDTSTAGFVAGMLLATALLHLVGMLIGLAAARARQQTA